MKLSRLLALAAIASTSALISCAGPAGYNYKNVAIALTYQPICSGICLNGGVFTPLGQPLKTGDQIGPSGAIELPITASGSCVEITATITNAPPNFTWTIYPNPSASVPTQPSGTSFPPAEPGINVGTLSSAKGSQNYYCEPGSIPVYTGATLVQAQALGLQQGETEIVVTAPADPNNPTNTVSATQTFTAQLNTPPSQKEGTVLVGITPANALTIPLGSQFQFSGYVVGYNGYYTVPGTTTQIPGQSLVWFVNNIQGGNASVGTISSTGLYTAPSTYPPATTGSGTSKTVLITAASAAFPSIVTGGVGQGTATTITFP